MVEHTPVLFAAEMKATESSFHQYIGYGHISRVTHSESDKVRHSALARENLTNKQSQLGSVARYEVSYY